MTNAWSILVYVKLLLLLQKCQNKENKKISMTNNCSTLVYVKLLLLWALVLATDYLLEFRFEYLWWALHSCFSFSLSILSINCLTVTICPCNRPFWLLVRSIYDSFKYQGLVIILPYAAQNYTNLSFFRHFQYFSSASPWPATWSASYLSLSTGCSSQQALMSGCSMCGTQVEPNKDDSFLF